MPLSKFQIFLFYLLGLGLGLSYWSCQPVEESQIPNDRLLAQVFNKSLFHSELEGMVPAESSPQDSALIVNAYVERWVRESLLMHEAERNIPKDLNIDELVRNYRASLIRHNYERLLVELQLDSTVTTQQLTTYYEENKSQYQLDHPILRCLFVKVPKSAPENEQLKNWWKDNQNESNVTSIVEYSSRYANVYNMNDSIWYKYDDIALQLPKAKRNDLANRKNLSFTDDDFLYLIKVLERMKVTDVAPMAYVKNQLAKVILHQRTIALLSAKKEEMYDRETRRNNVQIFAK
ncbi:MAG: hypothetical protein AAF985_21425 [Bacteroidota bacterium]